jgi:hypothetical protein
VINNISRRNPRTAWQLINANFFPVETTPGNIIKCIYRVPREVTTHPLRYILQFFRDGEDVVEKVGVLTGFSLPFR